ncbi:hypothetical protein [Burkholderia cepacia]|uniref:hypothetical protein n=1 Tax=Burkholderia cepacia TaxID=292 RepID=UPI001CF295B9|nr:hypothetical protein [Burkholderia cepacia]MCA8133947.1 hypothetical protein [Burkholderia cepacia]
MIEIRAVWEISSKIPASPHEAVNTLISLETSILESGERCLAFAKAFIDEDIVAGIQSICQSAINDLVSGCELARAGYFKQAYSLWRSWFEQSIFSIYFLEAPMHREAWKVSEEVALSDSPQHRLMLHQLLTDSGERHPFSLVYGNRFLRLLEIFRIDAARTNKANRPIARAIRVLTALSQGVHGTYQPARVTTDADLSDRLKKHCLLVLTEAADLLNLFWLLLVASVVDLPENAWLALRDGDPDKAKEAVDDSEDYDTVFELASLFKKEFGVN